MFISVDVKEIQPDLALSGYMDLSSRIKWVHTDLYEICPPRFIQLTLTSFTSLNPLPFASNVFDFVRIRYIGLTVPEDKVHSFTSHN